MKTLPILVSLILHFRGCLANASPPRTPSVANPTGPLKSNLADRL